MANNSRRKIAIVGVSSLILVAMVVALTIGIKNDDADDENSRDVNASRKAIQTICESTDYKDTCINTLNSKAGNTSDPKELIQAAFQVTVNYIKDAADHSTLLQQLQQDPRTRLALENCRELAERAVDDLDKSFSKFKNFDFMSSLDDMLNDLKIWLSGALTYQETCLDGFEDTPGDAGQKMREALNTSMELTSNGLAMIGDLSSVLSSFDFSSFNKRRLLSEDLPILGNSDENQFPDWFDGRIRRLIDASPNDIRPDLVVAKDGSGKYRTINEALNDIPKNSNRTFILYIKRGVYEEKVRFNSSFTHLMIIGDGPTNTKITGHLNFIDGTPTYHTATVAALGDYFIAKDIGFENSAGPDKHQAVALRVGADKSIFYNCQIDGYQDTLYAHTYRQFYRDCVVSGTIDFVFGDSAAVFQNCTFVVRKPLDNQQNIVTAQGRKDARQPTGLVIQNCSFVADPAYYPFRRKLRSYLGRPWKEFSRTIIMESYIGDLIHPKGWLPWEGTFGLKTLFYTEFNNRGPGANKARRAKWPGVKELPASRIERFTAAKFIEAETWIPASGVPYNLSFIFPLPKEDPSAKYSSVAPGETKDLGRAKDKSSYYTRPDSSSSGKSKSHSSGSKKVDDVPSPSPSPSPAPAPYISSIASAPIEGGISPSPAPYISSIASAPIEGGFSPSPAPYSSIAAPPLQNWVQSPGIAPSPSAYPPAPASSPSSSFKSFFTIW